MVGNSQKTSERIQTYLSEPDRLYKIIRKKLENREIKTFKYADVPSRKAAVIVPIFFKNQEPHILFTKRTDKVEHHKGQISFPGGMQDFSDDDLKDTALRETWEEMGIKAEDITLLGRTDNFLTNTNFMVTPYVGFFPYPYPFIINRDEIASIFEVPLKTLLNPAVFRIEKWKRNGVMWDVHFYDFKGEMIWGVTGFLLSNFLSIVFGLPRMNDSPVG